MRNDEYKIEVEIDEGEMDKAEREQLISELNDEFGVELSYEKSTTELVDPATTLAIYSAGISTVCLYLGIKSYLDDKTEAANINIAGDIYVINADEADQIGATVVEEEENSVAADLSYEEMQELRKLREQRD